MRAIRLLRVSSVLAMVAGHYGLAGRVLDPLDLDPDAVGLAERSPVTYAQARWLIAAHGSVEAAERAIALWQITNQAAFLGAPR